MKHLEYLINTKNKSGDCLKIDKNNFSKFALILSMTIFGTIGIFKEYIPISSGLLAMLRGIIGSLFLLMLFLLSRKKINYKSIKNNFLLLIISGTAIGFNWILLFEAYNNTSIATATLSYYMAPIFVILASPIFLKEKLSIKQIICSMLAILGMIFVSGIFNEAFSGVRDLVGVFFGLGAALLYACVIILNKKIVEVDSFERTIIQLAAAGIIFIPYTIFFENNAHIVWNSNLIFLILLVCFLHTGITYGLYFYSINHIKAQTVAIYSYIDPIVAIILSAIFLKQELTVNSIIGAVLILGATLISEINFKKTHN